MTLGARAESALVRGSQLLAAGVVVGLGLLAAWPFRQNSPPWTAPPVASIPIELALRRPEAATAGVPLGGESPATELQDFSASENAAPQDAEEAAFLATEPSGEPLARLTSTLENLAPPPPLPVSFQPDREFRPAAPRTPWRPDSARGADDLTPVQSRPAPPRRYRLRDGDTLEGVAERFLGDRSRAEELYQRNRAVLSRPDLLPIGVSIELPPRRDAR